MLELNSTKLEIKFNGEVNNLTFPTVKQMREYAKNYEESDDKIEVITKFLIGLGLKKDVCDLLEFNHLEKILEELTKSKK